METQLINRVASSGIITINLEDFYPTCDFKVFDISDFLFHGLILKEKEFRTTLKELDWSVFRDKTVLILCSTDAIVPLWAYMLISQYLHGVANDIFVGTEKEFIKTWYYHALEKFDWTPYENQKIVVKGCGHKTVPEDAYARITKHLMPIAGSIMFGEPCSTVPVYKKKLM
ncbi:MAG: DUF2480 family protein [Saprospiraceae bacterium]|nr:DUF2480 family protein [Saprospiraceae bacterium]